MGWETRSVRLVKTPSGRIDSKYPLGTLPGTPLTWAAIPNQQATEGEIYSLNVRTYLSGTNSGTVTITVDGSLPTGWTFSGSTLSYSGTGTGVASVRFVADGTTNSLYLSVESVPVPVSDAQAPTAPNRLEGEAGTNQVTLTWDQAYDAHDGTLEASGVASYELYKDDVKVADVAASGTVSGATPLTEADIGSPSPAGASTQSGNDWSLESEGVVDGSADRFRFVYATLATPHVVAAKVASITGYTSAFAKAGVMVRASTAVDSAFVSAQARQNGTVRIEYRAATGGNRVTIGSASTDALDGVDPSGVMLSLRPGDNNVWTAYYSNDDGQTWAILESVAVSLPPNALHGMFCCSTTDGEQVTAEFEQFSLSPQTRVSRSYNTTTSGTYKVRAVDHEANTSGYSGTVIVTPNTVVVPPPPAQTRNWNPGHYVRPGPKLDTSGWESTYKGWIDVASRSDVDFKGVQIIAEWKNLEGAKDDYYGFAKIDTILDYAISKGKRISINVWWNNFGGGVNSKTSPNYINTDPMYGADYLRYATYGANVRVWNKATMDRFTQLGVKLMERYADSSFVEFIKMPGETAPGGAAKSQPDWNAAQLISNIRTLINTLAPLSKKAWFSFGGNWVLWSPSVSQEFLAVLAANSCGIGSTDPAGYRQAFAQNWVPTWETVQQYATEFDKHSFGLDTEGNPIGGTNYRGVIPHSVNVEGLIYDGNRGASITQCYDSAMFYISHLSWHLDSGKPGASQSQIISLLQSRDFELNYQDYPSGWATS